MERVHCIFFVIGILCISACQHKEESTLDYQEFKAYTSESKTKTSTDDSGTAIYWDPGDKIKVYLDNKWAGDFSAVLEEPSPIATFNGIMRCEDSTDGLFRAVSPASAAQSFSNESVTVEVPKIQYRVKGSFDKSAFVSVASSTDHTFHFVNVCGGIAFTITRSDVNDIKITSNGGEPIAGKVTVSFNADGEPILGDVVDGSSTIELRGGDKNGYGRYAECISPDTWYYVAMLPQVLSKGFTVYYQKPRPISGFFEKRYNEEYVVKRSTWGRLPEINITEAVIPIPDSGFKNFCVDNYDLDNDGEISLEEAEEVTLMNVNSSGVKSLDGLKHFTELTLLSCGENRFIKSIDISGMKNLSESRVFLNDSLLVINASNCPNLYILDCQGRANEYLWGALEMLDVTGDSSLTVLACQNNSLSILDLSTCKNLSTVYCIGNKDLKEIWLDSGQHISKLYYDSNVTQIKYIESGSIILNMLKLTLLEGDTKTILATIKEGNDVNQSLIWSSSNPEVATVAQDGSVTAVSVGTANIRVTNGDHEAICTVIVIKRPTGSDSGEIGAGQWNPGGDIHF